MKKLIASIAAMAMMSLGFVAVSGGAANAGTEYPGTVPTTTHASGGNVLKGKHVKTTVRVTSDSNTQVTGEVRITWKRVKGGFLKSKTFGYPGGKVTYTGPRLKKTGKYKATAKFIPDTNSVFLPSSDSYTFRVHR